MQFLKEHLIGSNYNWLSDINAALFSGEPRRRLFDRLNGDQVLYMINFFAESIGNFSVQHGQKLEALISTQLPDDLRSEIAVFNWLRGVYMYQMQ